MTFQSLQGLGAWPTDPYYDASRPSWLPYWVDDLTESKNKALWAAGNVVGYSIDPSGSAAQAVDVLVAKNAQADAQASWDEQANTPPPPPAPASISTAWWIVGGMVIALLAMGNKR